MIRRLARWLRIIGCDTEFVFERDHDRVVAVSERDDRIILTRDRKVGPRMHGHGPTLLIRLVQSSMFVVLWFPWVYHLLNCVGRDVWCGVCVAQLLERKDIRACFFLPTHDTAQQFSMVTQHFGVVCSNRDVVSRCAKCNGEVKWGCTLCL